MKNIDKNLPFFLSLNIVTEPFFLYKGTNNTNGLPKGKMYIYFNILGTFTTQFYCLSGNLSLNKRYYVISFFV